MPSRTTEAASGFENGPSAHATYGAAPITRRAMEMYSQLPYSDRERTSQALADALLATGDIQLAFAVSLDSRDWDVRLGIWNDMLDSLRLDGRFGDARQMAEQLSQLEDSAREAQRLDAYVALTHRTLASIGQLEAARKLVKRLQDELQPATIKRLGEREAVHQCAIVDALFGSELTAAKRLDALTRYPGSEPLVGEVQLALCARAFRDGDLQRGSARFDQLPRSILSGSDPLVLEVHARRALADFESGQTSKALDRAARHASSSGSNGILLRIQALALDEGDLEFVVEASERATRRDVAGWRDAVTTAACAEIRSGQVLEGAERLATLEPLERKEALRAADAYHASGQAAPIGKLAAGDAALRVAIKAHELALPEGLADRDAFLERTSELSASMPADRVFPRIELLEVLAGLRQPEQTQRELDLVLTAALDQSDADPELRARAFALDTRLRGGFGIQRRLARLGTSAQSVNFLIEAIHASLSLDQAP